MDNITELLVKKEKGKGDAIKKFGLVMGVLIACLIAAVFLSGTPFMVLAWASFVYLGIKMNERMSVEYDYCLIEGSLDIDKVFSAKTRKSFISIEQSTVELVAPFGCAELNEFSKLKTYYATNKNDDNKYVVVGVNKGAKCKVVINGDERIVSQYRKCIPRKVILK